LYTFTLADRSVGIIGCAVGAPFAVLLAEELFASGCRFFINLTSAGQIVAAGRIPYFACASQLTSMDQRGNQRGAEICVQGD
jgi:hypothetical protein